MDGSTTTSSTTQPPHGCGNSSPTDTCPPGTWTNAALRTLSPATCAVIDSIIFSQGSAGGRLLWPLPDGRLIDPCGLAHALASLSARQVRELGLQTSGICGRPGSTSSRSADLQRSLESRLQARLSGRGSILFKLTWKAWATPSGVSRFRLRASALRTSEIERTGWPTPSATDHKGGYEGGRIRNGKLSTDRLDVCAQIAGWPTPVAADSSRGGETMMGGNLSLLGAAKLSGWPTPTAALASKGVRSIDGGIREAMRNHGPDLAAISTLTACTCPKECDCENPDPPSGAALVSMGCPIHNHNPRPHPECPVHNGPARLTADGTLLTGSDAAMESGGQLNPAHSRWLMGFPAAWCESAIRARRSMPRGRRRPA